ncbi:MAG: hypothetical protein D6806_13865 [Deltaproteobacteria bacterium]|nr:MAG: hypothetical protein D6806_13865 [Deltaproteobacteria bacterium]
MAAAGCGEPTIDVPEPLRVVYLPLQDARDVDPQMAVFDAYFSGAVYADSINSDSVFVKASPWQCSETDPQDCSCTGQWSDVGGSASQDTGNPSRVVFQPDDNVDAGTCYVLVFTTAVRGQQAGPLASLGMPDERKSGLGIPLQIDVGAFESFWTAGE